MREKPLTEFIGSKKAAKENKEKPAEPKVAGLKGPWELPEGWRWVRLGDLGKFEYGYTASATTKDTGVKFLRITDIDENGNIKWEQVPFCEISKKELEKYALKKEDLLFARIGATTGKATYIPKDTKAVFASYLIRLKIMRSDVFPKFVFYFAQTPYYWANIKEEMGDKLRKGINAKELSRILVPLPPLEEQKRIVAKLDEISKRLDEAKKLAREAKEEAENLMASALHEVFSKAKEKGWEWVRLDKLFTIQQGASLSPKRREGKNPLPFLRTKNVRWGYVDVSELDYMDFTPAEVEKLKLKPGDLLVLEGGEIGRTAIWRGELETCLYQNHIHRLRRRNTNVLPEFYMYWMQAAYKVFNSYSKEGVRTAIPNLSKSRLAAFKVPFPPLEEQKRIVTYLDSISERAQRLVKLYEERERELEQLFPAILDRAFRGEV